MSWYFCYGCGPSYKCDVCGATPCAQNFDPACLGCATARHKTFKERPPRNVNIVPPEGTRPRKMNRKAYNAWVRQRRTFAAGNVDPRPRLYGKGHDHRSRRQKAWSLFDVI
jgi:hypothetical protein